MSDNSISDKRAHVAYVKTRCGALNILAPARNKMVRHQSKKTHASAEMIPIGHLRPAMSISAATPWPLPVHYPPPANSRRVVLARANVYKYRSARVRGTEHIEG